MVSHAGARLLADGGEAISDLAVLRDQPELFGQVASPATAWRVLDGIGSEALARIRAARAQAREIAWTQHADTRGTDLSAFLAPTSGGGSLHSFELLVTVCEEACLREISPAPASERFIAGAVRDSQAWRTVD